MIVRQIWEGNAYFSLHAYWSRSLNSTRLESDLCMIQTLLLVKCKLSVVSSRNIRDSDTISTHSASNNCVWGTWLFLIYLYLAKAKNVYNSVSSRHLFYVLSIPFRDGVFPMCSIKTLSRAWTKIISCLSFSKKLEAENVQTKRTLFRGRSVITVLSRAHDAERCGRMGKGCSFGRIHFAVFFF